MTNLETQKAARKIIDSVGKMIEESEKLIIHLKALQKSIGYCDDAVMLKKISSNLIGQIIVLLPPTIDLMKVYRKSAEEVIKST